MEDFKKGIVRCVFDILNESNGAKTTITDDQIINSSIYEEYGINSLEMISLIMKLEEKFEIQFNDSELKLENFETVESIANTIINHIKR